MGGRSRSSARIGREPLPFLFSALMPLSLRVLYSGHGAWRRGPVRFVQSASWRASMVDGIRVCSGRHGTEFQVTFRQAFAARVRPVSHPERPPWLGLAVFVLSTCAGAHVSRSSEPLCPKEPVCRLRASWFSACELDCHGP